jgi:hypothetical protein
MEISPPRSRRTRRNQNARRQTGDNLLTWNYLDNYVQVSGPARVRTSEEAPPPRPGRQMQIPICRAMKKLQMKSILVEEYNRYEENRFVR